VSAVAQNNYNETDGDQLVRNLGPKILGLLKDVKHVELTNFSMDIGDLDLFIPTSGFCGGLPVPVHAQGAGSRIPTAIIPEQFTPYQTEYPGKIREVTLGATKSQGGSRNSTVTIGGSTTPAYTDMAHLSPNPPVIALDVFDMPISLPAVLKENVAEVLDNPAEWAKLNVTRFGADVVTIHLMSTDPLFRDTSPAAAAKTVEEILQAVDVPLIIGGCGDPKKDAAVFTEISEMAAGERLLLNSVTLDMAEAKTLEGLAKSAKENGHLLLAFTGLELNNAKELNRRLYEYLPPEQIVMDLTTVALGYGLEYSFTIHERARYAALMGDTELAHPVISAATNAWAAREAWMKMPPQYGPKELRGPIWETINAVTLLLAGVDLFLMMHPAAVLTLREIIAGLGQAADSAAVPVPDWVEVRL
jgi:acetyl-CoA decarbonylase/synthase complex subunit delta